MITNLEFDISNFSRALLEMSDSVSFESGSHLHVYIAHLLQHVNLIFLLNPILTYNGVVPEESDKKEPLSVWFDFSCDSVLYASSIVRY